MIKKENQQHQPWSKEDSQFAWDYFAKGKSHDWIAKKLGRSVKAVEINISKTRVSLKTVPFKLENFGPSPAIGPAVVKQPRKAKAKKQEVVELVEHDQKYWLMFFTGFAGGMFGAVVTAFIL
jgi:hypothetical protein|tara:strand:- start:57 stop:422 length:366 start_codon:yes stop_codon:yes gene_type:complete